MSKVFSVFLILSLALSIVFLNEVSRKNKALRAVNVALAETSLADLALANETIQALKEKIVAGEYVIIEMAVDTATGTAYVRINQNDEQVRVFKNACPPQYTASR
jgi:hypothetical protein